MLAYVRSHSCTRVCPGSLHFGFTGRVRRVRSARRSACPQASGSLRDLDWPHSRGAKGRFAHQATRLTVLVCRLSGHERAASAPGAGWPGAAAAPRAPAPTSRPELVTKLDVWPAAAREISASHGPRYPGSECTITVFATTATTTSPSAAHRRNRQCPKRTSGTAPIMSAAPTNAGQLHPWSAAEQ